MWNPSHPSSSYPCEETVYSEDFVVSTLSGSLPLNSPVSAFPSQYSQTAQKYSLFHLPPSQQPTFKRFDHLTVNNQTSDYRTAKTEP